MVESGKKNSPTKPTKVMLLTFESFKRQPSIPPGKKSPTLSNNQMPNLPRAPRPLKNLSSSPTVHGIPGRWVPSTQLEHKPWRREVLIYQAFWGEQNEGLKLLLKPPIYLVFQIPAQKVFLSWTLGFKLTYRGLGSRTYFVIQLRNGVKSQDH